MPLNVLYALPFNVEGAKVTDGTPSEFLTGIPTVTNADTLGIRPDLVERPVSSWADLLSPEFKGKAALQDGPANRFDMDRGARVGKARGDLKYGAQRQHDQGRNRQDDGGHDRPEKIRSVPFVLEFIRSVGEPDGLG